MVRGTGVPGTFVYVLGVITNGGGLTLGNG